jgi:hypothetical protein
LKPDRPIITCIRGTNEKEAVKILRSAGLEPLFDTEEAVKKAEEEAAAKAEAEKVAAGEWPKDNNPLVNAPHTLADITDSEWDRPYDRKTATYPVEAVGYDKFWPTVNRIDDVFGDRNMMCSCPSIEEYR